MAMNVDLGRRNLVLGSVAAGAATTASAQIRTDTAPRILNGQPMPEPNPDQSAGPVRPGPGSQTSRQGGGGYRRSARHRSRHCG
jgi:hypothetical protein